MYVYYKVKERRMWPTARSFFFGFQCCKRRRRKGKEVTLFLPSPFPSTPLAKEKHRPPTDFSLFKQVGALPKRVISIVRGGGRGRGRRAGGEEGE